MPARLVIVPDRSATGGAPQIDCRNDALMQQQHVDLAPLLAGRRLPDDFAQPVPAFRSQHADVAFDRHLAQHGAKQRQSLQEIARGDESRQMPGRAAPVRRRRRVEDQCRPAPRCQQLSRVEIKQRPAAGDHRFALRHHARCLQHGLRRSHRHHARQCPAGNRHGPLHGAGRHHDLPRTQQAGAGRIADSDLDLVAFGAQHPDLGARRVFHRAALEPHRPVLANPVGAAKNPPLAHRRRGDGAIYLAARRGVLVEQHYRGAARGGRRRRRHAGRPCADVDQVEDVRHRDWPGMRRAPCCGSTFMPSRTVTMQAWRLATPSITIRQSKHTPIMQ